MTDGDRHPQDRLRPVLTLPDAVLLIVSSVVGSGIFLTPGRIADLLPHPGLIFAAWLAGGALSLAGALANAELGSMFPHAGGDYVYLREAFNRVSGYMVGWLTFVVIFVGTIATLAAGFASLVAPYTGYDDAAVLPLAIGVTVAFSALNWVGVRWGALANNLSAGFKVLALAAFCVLGPLLGEGSAANLAPLFAGVASAAPLAAFGLALSPVLFSFLGWNSTIYVASEIKDAARNVPRSLFLGLALCTAVYLVMNAVYLYAMPVSELRGVDDAGRAAAQGLFGDLGGRLLTGFVIVSILGTLNATILVGPRIAYAMALDGLFFKGLDAAHVKYGTPHMAIGLQGAVTVALLVVLDRFPSSLFVSALDSTVFAILLAMMADVAALYRLRRTQPGRPRPYRAWGYPLVPALYAVTAGALALNLFAEQPRESGVVLLMVASGVPFYFWFTRGGRPGPAPGS